MSKRFVLVTGAAGGIGKATVRTLISQGFTVLAGVLNEDEEASLRDLDPSKMIPVTLDTTDDASIKAAMKYIRTVMAGDGKLYGVVNNAGVCVNAPIQYMTTAEIRTTVNVNFVGSLLVTRAALSLMAPGSRVVFISSAAGFVASPTVTTYAATKAAIEAMADALRLELEPLGISVVAIEPGVVQTPMTAATPEVLKTKLDQMPAEDRARYEDVMTKIVNISFGDNVGIKPSKVADTVVRALTASKPKNRYPVGMDAHAAHLLRYLPSRVRDFVQRKILGM